MKHTLIFKAVEPAFHQRIIPAIALAAHAENRLHLRNQSVEPARHSAKPRSLTYAKTPAHHLARIATLVTFDPGALYRSSIAQYAVAFSGWPRAIKISTSLSSRAFSAQTFENSICSPVIGLLLRDAPDSLLSRCALRQRCSVCSTMPSSGAAAAWRFRSTSTRQTAVCLNSNMLCCFGNRLISSTSNIRIILLSFVSAMRSQPHHDNNS